VFIYFVKGILMKNTYKFIRFIIIPFLLVFLSLNQEAKCQLVNTPDGELVIKKEMLKLNNNQFRFVSTQGVLYLSQYRGGKEWGRAIPLYSAPFGRRIVDFTHKILETGNTRTIAILLDDGTTVTTVVDVSLQIVVGTANVISPPTGNIVNLKKVLFSNSLYILYSYRAYINKLDGNPWSVDTVGLSRATINDFFMDSVQNVIASTSKGLFTQSSQSQTWNKLTVNDYGIINTAFITSDSRKFFFATETNGVFYSTSEDPSWKPDTIGIGNNRVMNFGDDLDGKIYVIVNPTSSLTFSIYKQDSPGTSWVRIDSNLIISTGTSMRIYDIGGLSTLEAATPFGMFSSDDAGLTWSPSSSGILSEQIYGCQFLANNKSVISTGLGVFTQDVQDGAWTKRYPLNKYMAGNNIQKDGAGNLWMLGTTTGGSTVETSILKSIDAGITWNYDTLSVSNIVFGSTNYITMFYIDNPGNQYYGISGFPNNTIALYTRYNGGNWLIDSTGTNLITQTTGKNEVFLTYGSDNINNVYFSDLEISMQQYTATSLYKRPLTGGSWQLDTAGLKNSAISSMAADQTGQMFAGSLANGKVSGIFHKTGNTWQSINVPPAATTDVKNIACDPTGAVYASFGTVISTGYNSITNKGIYKTTDLGNTWFDAGLSNLTVRGLVANTDMYAYSNRGLYKLAASPLKIPAYTINPRTIVIDTVLTGYYQDTTVIITNISTDTLHVSNITSTNTTITAQTKKFNVNPGENYNLVVRFRPTATRTENGVLRILSDAYMDSIVVKGFGYNPNVPIMVLSQRFLDFGNVMVETSKSDTVLINNTGKDTLHISLIQSMSQNYSTSKYNKKVAPKSADTLIITFTPYDIFTYDGVINITSTDASVLPDSIVVTGKGIPQSDVKDNDPGNTESLNFAIQPNPVVSDGKFHFILPWNSMVSIRIHDVLGNQIVTAYENSMFAGEYSIPYNFAALPNGIYYCRIITERISVTVPIIIMK
jgi:hypothetical protein